MREPWASVLRGLVRTYVAIGTLLAIIAYGQFHLIGDPPTLDQCLLRLGLGADLRVPAQFAYLGYKAVLWPVSLSWTKAEGEVATLDWIFARYDPFAGACEPP